MRIYGQVFFFDIQMWILRPDLQDVMDGPSLRPNLSVVAVQRLTYL